MMSFIKKDFLMIKANIKIFILIMIVYILMSFSSAGEFDMAFFFPFFAAILFLSTFSYDEFNNWNAYAITLPNGRKNLLKGKYVGTILIVLLTSILSLGISIGLGIYKDTLVIEEIISSLLTSLVTMFIVVSFSYPLIYKLGVEKGRIAMMIIIFVGAGIMASLEKTIGFDKLESIFSFLNDWYYIALPLVIIISLLISYFISIKIYLKKEF